MRRPDENRFFSIDLILVARALKAVR